jgi:hypothetical protein
MTQEEKEAYNKQKLKEYINSLPDMPVTKAKSLEDIKNLESI